jgi:hypothetical protein
VTLVHLLLAAPDRQPLSKAVRQVSESFALFDSSRHYMGPGMKARQPYPRCFYLLLTLLHPVVLVEVQDQPLVLLL